MPASLILASTSRYRAELLARLRVPFTTCAPGVDETPVAGEEPAMLATRLALAKARAVATGAADALVIGSDQVAHCDGHILGKPGSHTAAVAQLRLMRGRVTLFETALAVVHADSGRVQSALVQVEVAMRDASDAEIEAYLRLEQPYDCAGSAKSEGLGIVMMERITCNDPTALVGLPLITLAGMLRNEGISLPGQA